MPPRPHVLGSTRGAQEANDLIRVTINRVGRVDATAQRCLVETGQPLDHLVKLGVGPPGPLHFVT